MKNLLLFLFMALSVMSFSQTETVIYDSDLDTTITNTDSEAMIWKVWIDSEGNHKFIRHFRVSETSDTTFTDLIIKSYGETNTEVIYSVEDDGIEYDVTFDKEKGIDPKVVYTFANGTVTFTGNIQY